MLLYIGLHHICTSMAISLCNLLCGLAAYIGTPTSAMQLNKKSPFAEQFCDFVQRNGTKFCVTLTWKFNSQLCRLLNQCHSRKGISGASFGLDIVMDEKSELCGSGKIHGRYCFVICHTFMLMIIALNITHL